MVLRDLTLLAGISIGEPPAIFAISSMTMSSSKAVVPALGLCNMGDDHHFLKRDGVYAISVSG